MTELTSFREDWRVGIWFRSCDEAVEDCLPLLVFS